MILHHKYLFVYILISFKILLISDFYILNHNNNMLDTKITLAPLNFLNNILKIKIKYFYGKF